MKHLKYIANVSSFDLADYDQAIEYRKETDAFIYMFSNNILDAWDIELNRTSCFPISIRFTGDF